MPRMKNPNRPKRSPLDGYKTYDPSVEGYGSSFEWRQAFKFTMGLDEARETVGSESPRSILGVGLNDTWDTIKRTFWKLVKIYHPDVPVTGDADMFRKFRAAFEVIKDEFRRKGVVV